MLGGEVCLLEDNTSCLIYKDGCSDDNEGCFNYKVYCFDNKEPCRKNNKDGLQNYKCRIEDNEVNLDWLSIIVGLQEVSFAKRAVLFGSNDYKLVNNDPGCDSRVPCCKNNDCCFGYSQHCLHYNEGDPDYRNEIVRC